MGSPYTTINTCRRSFQQRLHSNRTIAYHCAVTFLAFHRQIGLSMKEPNFTEENKAHVGEKTADRAASEG